MMRSGLFAGVGLVVMCWSFGAWAQAKPEAATTTYEREAPFAKQWGLLDDYCSKCHNFTDWAGEVAFAALSPEGVPAHAAIWDACLRKRRGHKLPPPASVG